MQTEGFTLPSFAKVNLYLRVIGKRNDGYHEIVTVFQTISLHDEITFKKSNGLEFTCNDPLIPTGPDNLILRAAEALRSRFAINDGAAIDLRKIIPSPGGLGGGSSNAAVTLLGLRTLWGLSISDGEIAEMAATLGSDVPFFLFGGTAIGTGRGEILEPMGDFASQKMVVVTPDVDVSSQDAYIGLDRGYLTKDDSRHTLSVCRSSLYNPNEWRSAVVNDFEEFVFAEYPEVKAVRDRLLEVGAASAGLSGSGASVFGFFDKEETRQTALKALGDEANWRSFAVATISRTQYREALKQVF